MQIQSMIFCKKALSLRKKIVSNEKLEQFGFCIKEIQKQNRGCGRGGWTKIVHGEYSGSINIRWNDNMQCLEIWTITRDTNPLPIYGQFLIFLSIFSKEIKSGALSIS